MWATLHPHDPHTTQGFWKTTSGDRSCAMIEGLMWSKRQRAVVNQSGHGWMSNVNDRQSDRSLSLDYLRWETNPFFKKSLLQIQSGTPLTPTRSGGSGTIRSSPAGLRTVYGSNLRQGRNPSSVPGTSSTRKTPTVRKRPLPHLWPAVKRNHSPIMIRN